LPEKFLVRPSRVPPGAKEETWGGEAIRALPGVYDRIVIVTDEQSADVLPPPPTDTGGKGYVINVGTYKNGIGYGSWTHINGFSESVVRYIQEMEKPSLQ
jgi:hypothetical protein